MADSYRSSGALSLILLTYVRPLDEVDAQMAAHVEFLERNLAEGEFLIAGRRDPRTGGVIVARGGAETVAALAGQDPFVTSGVAEFEVVAFNMSFAQPEIAGLLA
ncbi:MAG: hypothetical protein CMN72_13825 [Sphingomonas sp.]|nr:hypothetical protein [Sphingomonas sp.]